jgi:protein farnesyltransferase/geranylgeranyltransferase type-1 subunit alpha
LLSKKGQREFWKQLSEANVPLRSAPRPKDDQWGCDKDGRDIGDYTPEQYATYERKKARLSELRLESAFFKHNRQRALQKTKNPITGEAFIISQDDIAAEKKRRQEMASLRNELYGTKEAGDAYANDPEWDDVVPIPQEEPEGALSVIAYTENYAEGMHCYGQ